MRNEISVSLLKPHPKNQDYYDDLPDEKYQEVKRSIEAHGIRDPLKVLPDYTVVSGHQRRKIAQELGLKKVPVVILDVSPEEAEYLLIADNEERRQSDDDPIRKAKRAKFLKEYWGIHKGRPEKIHQFDEIKTAKDVARAVGVDTPNLNRLLKLNDLIDPLQNLVSAGKLSQAAAHSLAFLPPEEQEELLRTLGESGVCGLSAAEARELRKELDAVRKEKESLQDHLTELEGEKDGLSRQLAGIQDSISSMEEEIAEKLGRRYEEKLQGALSGLRQKLDEKQAEAEDLRARLKELKQKPVEKIVQEVVYKIDPALEAELEAARRQNVELLKEKEWLRSRFEAVAQEKEKKEAKLRVLESEAERLQRMLDHARKELEKEKSRPKPPQWSKEHLEFRALMEEASRNAASLAAALSQIEERHAERFLAAARVRGASELEEMAEVMGDALLFRSFDAGLNAAAGRIGRVWDVLEPGKPKLQVLKGKGDS
ncbi:MAG: chromosome partitioning protein ParB [Desulforudis sp.]|nr:MAG: chromosome partitioning protein ParB [Desulforudis sp.]